ncbi:uncharacterized protein BROUX77_006949 [Berkeleyomyces rouxiae]|uniref:uncharacterized protein n=1 Tax=Berkeleyomyces rouxiae TaxID=2035830 RepID=UPI003B7D6A4A
MLLLLVLSSLLGSCSAEVWFTTSVKSVALNEPFNITWTTDAAPVNLTLETPLTPSNSTPESILISDGLERGWITWTPKALPRGAAYFFRAVDSSGMIAASSLFQIIAKSTRVSAALSPSHSSTMTTTTKTTTTTTASSTPTSPPALPPPTLISTLSSSPSSLGSLSAGKIAGIVVGALAGLCILFFGLFYMLRRKKATRGGDVTLDGSSSHSRRQLHPFSMAMLPGPKSGPSSPSDTSSRYSVKAGQPLIQTFQVHSNTPANSSNAQNTPFTNTPAGTSAAPPPSPTSLHGCTPLDLSSYIGSPYDRDSLATPVAPRPTGPTAGPEPVSPLSIDGRASPARRSASIASIWSTSTLSTFIQHDAPQAPQTPYVDEPGEEGGAPAPSYSDATRPDPKNKKLPPLPLPSRISYPILRSHSRRSKGVLHPLQMHSSEGMWMRREPVAGVVCQAGADSEADAEGGEASQDVRAVMISKADCQNKPGTEGRGMPGSAEMEGCMTNWI